MTVQTNHLEDVDTAIDWDATPQCEHREHLTDEDAHDDGDAAWNVKWTCGHCGATKSGLRCQGWRDFIVYATHSTIVCVDCRGVCTTAEYFEQTVWVKL